MASEVKAHTRDRIWQEMLDVARYIHYYETLTNRYARYSRLIRAVIFVGAALSIGLSLDVLPRPLGVVAGVSAAVALLVATIGDFIWDWGTKASISHAINIECCIIQTEYTSLWSMVETGMIDDSEAQSRSSHLVLRAIAATAQLSETNRKLNATAQKAAYTNVSSRWKAEKWHKKRDERRYRLNPAGSLLLLGSLFRTPEAARHWKMRTLSHLQTANPMDRHRPHHRPRSVPRISVGPALSPVGAGGPILTVDRTIFEMWLGVV